MRFLSFYFSFSIALHRLVFASVRMTASYKIGENPFVRGARLRGDCVFSAIRFIPMQMANGGYNDATACHLIDGEYSPLEMQLFAENGMEKIRISYFFTRQTRKNFGLEPLISHLESVKSMKSFKSVSNTFCLEQIIPKIESGFYVYDKYVTVDGHRAMMRCIIEAHALIPIGSTQLERIQKIQQDLIFRDDGHHSVGMNHIYLRQYLRQRRSDRLAHKGIRWLR